MLAAKASLSTAGPDLATSESPPRASSRFRSASRSATRSATRSASSAKTVMRPESRRAGRSGSNKDSEQTPSKIVSSCGNIPSEQDSKINSAAVEDEAYLLKPFRDMCLPLVQNEFSDAILCKFQKFCGVSDGGKVKNEILHNFFIIASNIGENLIGVVPFLVWCDREVSYIFTVHFTFILLLGQLMKDLCRLPRPFHNKNVARLEKCFETEYGFPSTHTMCGMLPFALVYSLTHNRKTELSAYIYYGCFAFAILVALSRLYLGVHSPFDIAGGFLLAYLSTLLLKDWDSLIIDVLFRSQWGIIGTILITFAFILLFPRARPWRAGFGTASLVVGLFSGCSSAFWFLNIYGQSTTAAAVNSSLRESSSELFQIVNSFVDNPLILFTAKRYLVGVVLAALLYPIMKTISRKVLMLLYNADIIRIPEEEQTDCQGDRVDIYKAYNIEIPARILTLIPMCWFFIIGIPLIWTMSGMNVQPSV